MTVVLLGAVQIEGNRWKVVTLAGDEIEVVTPDGQNTAQAAVAAVEEMISPPPSVQADIDLRTFRASLTCSPLQGHLALGQTISAQLLAMQADPNTPWALRMALERATIWERNSDTIDQMGALLGLTDEQMDALFVAARAIRV
jgi:hypothetical protein